MNKNEIKQLVEENIEFHCDEFGLEREEVIDVVLGNFIIDYENERISREDLLQCAEYLECEIDIDYIDKEIEIRRIQRAKRKAYKERKRQEKLQNKLKEGK